MYSFRKSKKGFTLIELMVVVAIIGVLALLGLRLYTGQQTKAKEAIAKANAGSVQTLIQSELADGSISNYASLVAGINSSAGMKNSFLNTDPVCLITTNAIDTGTNPGTPVKGTVYVLEKDVGTKYIIRAYGGSGLLPDILTAQL